MSTKKNHPKVGTSYFITFTCFRWINLIEYCDIYDDFYNWFKFLKSMEVLIIAYVIMPNHFHGILHLPKNSDVSLNKIIGNSKRLLAYQVIRKLKLLGDYSLSKYLSNSVDDVGFRKGQKHRVFNPSFDAKEIYNKKMLMTKLNYIHLNPIQSKWRLVNNYWDYNHSSAGYYKLGIENEYVTHYKKITWLG